MGKKWKRQVFVLEIFPLIPATTTPLQAPHTHTHISLTLLPVLPVLLSTHTKMCLPVIKSLSKSRHGKKKKGAIHFRKRFPVLPCLL